MPRRTTSTRCSIERIYDPNDHENAGRKPAFLFGLVIASAAFQAVIASAAKQSRNLSRGKGWIASALKRLAMTLTGSD
jgi:hypothetical protein